MYFRLGTEELNVTDNLSRNKKIEEEKTQIKVESGNKLFQTEVGKLFFLNLDTYCLKTQHKYIFEIIFITNTH